MYIRAAFMKGWNFFIDIDTLTAQSVWVQGEFDINFHKVVDRFCPDGATYISPATSEVEEILTKLFGAYLMFSIPILDFTNEIYTLALFHLLQVK